MTKIGLCILRQVLAILHVAAIYPLNFDGSFKQPEVLVDGADTL